MATQATPFTFYRWVFNNLLAEFKALRLTHGVMDRQDSFWDEQQMFFICLWLFPAPSLNEEQELLKWLHYQMSMQVNIEGIQRAISNIRWKQILETAE